MTHVCLAGAQQEVDNIITFRSSFRFRPPSKSLSKLHSLKRHFVISSPTIVRSFTWGHSPRLIFLVRYCNDKHRVPGISSSKKLAAQKHVLGLGGTQQQSSYLGCLQISFVQRGNTRLQNVLLNFPEAGTLPATAFTLNSEVMRVMPFMPCQGGS